MKLLLYCTKAEPYITKGTNGSVYPSCVISDGIKEWHLNGKIVAECDYEVKWCDTSWCCGDFIEHKGLEKSCLTKEQLFDYVKGRNEFYAIHIKNLHIFDKPKELNEVYKIEDVGGMLFTKPLTKAPQNMMRVSVNHWDYATYNPDDIRILISIQSQWMCLILNRIKDVEVRRVVLKEMLNNE